MWNESEQERKERRKVLDFLHRGRMMPSGKKRKITIMPGTERSTNVSFTLLAARKERRAWIAYLIVKYKRVKRKSERVREKENEREKEKEGTMSVRLAKGVRLFTLI